MAFQIDILNVSGPIHTAGRNGGYDHIEVAFKKDGKVEGKKILSFVNKKVYDLCLNMRAGEVYEVQSEKDDKGYWQWTGVSKLGESATVTEVVPGAVEVSPSGKAQGRGVNRVVGSTYETPEERAKKQVIITRLACLSQAVAAGASDNAAITEKATEFEKFIYKNLEKQAKKYLEVTLKDEPVTDASTES